MKKIMAYLKKYKKSYIFGGAGVFALIALGITCSWNCMQFHSYCENKAVCAFIERRLSSQEKKAFVAMQRYLKETGKTQLDTGVLRYVTEEEILEVGLKIRASEADAARQERLNGMAPRDKFSGNYNCLRQAYMNELSNEEILFLQSPQSRNVNLIKGNPSLRQMYLTSASKIMKCMNAAIQAQYMAEVRELTDPVQQPATADKK